MVLGGFHSKDSTVPKGLYGSPSGLISHITPAMQHKGLSDQNRAPELFILRY